MADYAENEIDSGLRHLALFYRGPAEYLAGVRDFVRPGLARAEPLLIAVPSQNERLLREQLAGDLAVAEFAGMEELGRNPGRIIPAVRAFADRHPGQRVRYLGEPAWPGRTSAEFCEAAKHEALINLAFAGTSAVILCPYDAAALPPAVIAAAAATHPDVIRAGRQQPSGSYLGWSWLPPECNRPLPAPPADAATLTYLDDLRPVRDFVAASAQASGMPPARAADLVLAVSELAANTLGHTQAGGTVRTWHTDDHVICQVKDSGVLTDPLAGRRLPDGEAPGGKGLWLVNQVCDLVQTRTGPAGTTTQLHMRAGLMPVTRPPGGQPRPLRACLG